MTLHCELPMAVASERGSKLMHVARKSWYGRKARGEPPTTALNIVAHCEKNFAKIRPHSKEQVLGRLALQWVLSVAQHTLETCAMRSSNESQAHSGVLSLPKLKPACRARRR